MHHLARAGDSERPGASVQPLWSARLRTEPAALAAVFALGACCAGSILLLARGPDPAIRAPAGILAVALPLLAILGAMALDWRHGALTTGEAWRGALACVVVVSAWPAAAWGVPSRIPLWQLFGLFTPPFAIAIAAAFAWGGRTPTAGRCVRRSAAAYIGLCLPLLIYALSVPSAPGPQAITDPSLTTLIPYLVFGGVLIGLTVVPVGGLVGGYLRAGRLPAAANG